MENNSQECIGIFEEFQFSLGLEQVSGFIRAINKYADERVPWKLAKSSDAVDQKNFKTVYQIWLKPSVSPILCL